jgi:hypothetical protein
VADHVERVINPTQADVIQRVFREIAAGDGFCKIAKRLNAEGIPAPTRRGWAISGVREIVMRELYRGRHVYGKIRWERRKGTKRKVQTPASEGHVESPYLFTGFLRCETRGGAVHVSKQPSRGTMMFYYVCATHRSRGGTRCPTAVRARRRTVAGSASGARGRARRSARADRSLRAGLGDGVAVAEIRAQVGTLKLREQALTTELARLSPLPGAPTLDRAALRRRLVEWHSLLPQTPQVARQLLRKLLPEPIVLEPTPEGIRFRGRAAWAAILSGVMHGSGLVVRPEGFTRPAQQPIEILIAA